ncbi:REJ domain protein (macronuclear) [Tetrahymena thermophila SB210]|uniref:REJ domain protein n=1 Tax=Tetrahymena thermophila (strain SB210) TaxID=312017 RepID=I7M3U1_TETTS|nr:REJ domain protein [Tetrahymena thermophila SB210]EAS04297.2 REJ domain protein [Tetrahymena thermophila SB210]|eukprot:XP_001024542.2 REJ domain protein [Tetrahymena thermophila SB210]
MKNICLIFCLLCQIINPSVFALEYSLRSVIPQKEQRNLQSSQTNSNQNCQVQDQVLPQYCIKCIDLFLLPDCQSCPVEYKNVKNSCIQCGPHQLFCGSSNPQDYCYVGFTQIGSDCICELPKQIYNKWCTQLTDLVYEASYQNGEIIASFSVNITLGDSGITIYSNSNCGFLTNFLTDYGGQSIIQCALNSQNRNQFHISLNNTSLDQKIYEIIPQFNYSQIYAVDNNLNQYQATSITYQNQQLSSLKQFVYYQINDFSNPQCYFEYPAYYYQSINDNYSVKSSQFIQENNYFTNANPQFSISSSNLLQSNDLQQINQGFSTFPSYDVQLPIQFANTGTSITIDVTCLFPYNLISSSVVTFTTENSVNTKCKTYIINKKNLVNSDQILISVDCSFNDFTANQQTPISFQYNITQQNYANSQVASQNAYQAYQTSYQSYNLSPQIVYSQSFDLQISQFPYTITIPPYTFQPGKYYFQGVPIYSSVQGVSNLITLNISKAPLIVQIIGGTQVGLDPRIPLQIQGYVNNPAIQSQDPSQYTYNWSCIDLNLNKQCLDSQSNVVNFPSTQFITINSEVFDFGGSYQITLTGGYQSTQESGTDVVIFKTKPAIISVQYDQSYDLGNLNPSLTQKFLLSYSDSNILLSSNITNSYTKTYQDQTIFFPQQRETTIYSQINYLIPDQILASSFVFYYRFYAFNQKNQTVGYSKRYYFQTASPPQGCQINFKTPITGKEVAFVDLISLSIDNCQSSDNSQLIYQFLYYNSAQLINQEGVLPDTLYRQYLNKFSSNNTISTYLPPGNIVFVVLVQDQSGVQAQFQQGITILQNDFGEQQHEAFITKMSNQAQNYMDQQEYENELCTFGIVVECIHNFESSNPDIVPTTLINNFKYNMKNQLLILPNLIPNDIFSQSLQEFNFRCLLNLYLTRNSPDYQNLTQRIQDVQNVVQQITQVIQHLNLTQDLRETYKRSMLILCNITGQIIEMQSFSYSPSLQWSQDRINNFIYIQDAMSFVLQDNQKMISWDMPETLIQAQRVDEFNLFKNYLNYDQQLYDEKDFNLNKIYYVQMQYWKTNIYSFDQQFIDQYNSFLSLTNSQNLKYALQQVYPAIYPNITLVSSNRRHLQQQLTLNQTTLIKMKFSNLQGNKKVACVQRSEDSRWSKSTCTTQTTNQGDSFSVTCSCSQVHYTSLVADVEALFNNQNLQAIFSEQGFKSIINMSNWYKYACIYILIVLNILMVVSIIIGIKLDKINIYKSQVCTLGRSRAIFDQSTKIQVSKYIAYLNAQLTLENQQLENAATKPESSDNNNQIQQKLENQIQEVNYVGESQICKDYPTIQADTQVQQQVQYQQIQKQELQQETDQQQNQNLGFYQYPQIKLQEKEKNDNCNQIVTSSEYNPNTQYRINYQECQNHETHIFNILESIKKQQSILYDKSGTENQTQGQSRIQEIVDLLEFQKENRQLQIRQGASQNCQIFDTIQTDVCLKCFDKFILPDCTSCPVGYQTINNLCVQCGSNQLFCGSENQNDYCYQGFTKIGTDCAQWCTQLTNVIYQAEYSQGQVTVTFSANITFGGQSDFTPSNSNCLNYLTNFSTDYQNNQIIECSLDSQFNNLFHINVQQTDLTQGVYKIIPEFNYQQIFVIDNLNKKIPASSITYQNLQLTGQSQYVYHGINNFTTPQSYFTNSNYYFYPHDDNYIINPSLQFVQKNNYFTNSQPTVQIVKSSGLSDTDIYSIQQNLHLFPSQSIELPSSSFGEIGASLTISVVSPYPYNMISSSTASYTTEQSIFTNCTGSILNTTPLTNADQVQLSVNCNFNDFQANPLTSITFSYVITNKTNGNLIKQSSLQIQQFPYTLTLDSFLFNEGEYNFFGVPKYSSVQGYGFNLPLIIKRKNMVVQIVGGAKNQIDPRQAITIYAQISDPAIQNQDPTQYIYTWSCFDLVLNQNCQGVWFNQINFSQTQSITIMPEVFDFGGSYQITLIGSYSGTIDSATDIVIYQTLPATIGANYDASYDQKQLNPNQLLQFALNYNARNSNLQQSLNYTYSKTYQSSTLTFQSQRETTIFSQINEQLPDSLLSSSFKLYYRFYAINQSNKQVAFSKRYYFTTAPPPYNCQIIFSTQISGNEVAFVDQISLQVNNCQSNNNSQLYYQFLYYNQAEQLNKEQQFPNIYYRQYLSKFSTVNSITTFLPPGQIVFIVLVKDSNDIQIRYSNPITIKQNSFNQQQYESFLTSQNQQAQNFQSNSEFEEQLCSYGMMIQCIQNFENTNSNEQPSKFVSEVKENMKKQLLNLPNQISNDSMSQSLQEFDVRCLQNLYNTKNSPDSENQVNRLNNLESLLNQNTQIMNQLKPFTQDLRETYRRSMLIMLNMVGTTMDTLTSTVYNKTSIEWNKRRMDDIFLIQANIALTFYANQPNILWDTPQVKVFVQKIDEVNLFQNYLNLDSQSQENTQPDSNNIYNLQIQYWKTNIYSFEQAFIEQYQKYLLLTNSQNLKDQLQQTFPAIYPKLGIASSSRRLQQQDNDIDLPAPINLQFQNMKGNNRVVCTQRQEDGSWVKSFCTSKTVKQGDTFSTTCTCSKPNYTTLIADVDSLFDNQNLQNIFSQQGVKQISSLKDWYKYACIYILILINILMIGSLIFGCRLDKADLNNVFIGISTIGKSTTIQEDSQKKLTNSQKQEVNLNQKNNTPKQDDHTQLNINQNNNQFSPTSNQQTPQATHMLQSSNLLNNKHKQDNQYNETQTEGNNFQRLDHSLQIKIDMREHFNQQNQNTLTKTEAETNVQIFLGSEVETNKSSENNPYDQYRINYQECQNHDQHNFAIFEDFLNQKVSPQSDEEQQKNQAKLTKQQTKQMNKQLKQLKNSEIQQKSYNYLSTISVIRGICIFHDIIQIFIIFDKSQSRLCRLSIFYNQLIWLLTINSVFEQDLSMDKLFVLSIIASTLFGIFKVILKFALNKKVFKFIGYFLIFCFLIFCYYSILVAMSNQSPSDSNIWIENYLITLAIDLLIWSTISSFLKYLVTLKLLQTFQITHFIYKFTSANAIFSVYE